MNRNTENKGRGELFFVHPSAIVEEPACIGEGTKIWHFSHIMRNVLIGEKCTLGQSTFVASHVEIGNRVKIQNNVSLFEGVCIEDDVFVGPSAVFTNVLTPRSFVSRRGEFKKTRVQKGATIGANATVLTGITIGRYAMVGAGAVLTKSIPDYSLAVGNPARQVGWVCICGIRLRKGDVSGEWSCDACAASYRLQNDTLQPVQQAR